jgi:hypothetical protein
VLVPFELTSKILISFLVHKVQLFLEFKKFKKGKTYSTQALGLNLDRTFCKCLFVKWSLKLEKGKSKNISKK